MITQPEAPKEPIITIGEVIEICIFVACLWFLLTW